MTFAPSEINNFTKEFSKRISMEPELGQWDKGSFKELVNSQDKLYNKSCQEMAPKIWEYVCS